MPKIITSSEEARAKLLAGAQKLNAAVACTLGPGGRLVAIEREDNLPPYVTKDGVTVAREVHLTDPIEQIGARLVREAASRTVTTVGDGTTTSTVLATAILKRALELMATGVKPQTIKRYLQSAFEAAETALRAMAQPCTALQLAQVATVSANGDAEAGRIVAEAVGKVGTEGIVTVEEARDFKTTIEIHAGLSFSSGLPFFDFATDPRRGECVLRDSRGVLVLITNQELRFRPDFMPMIEFALYMDMPLLVVADDISDEALATMVKNLPSGLRICPIKTPRERFTTADALIADLCAATGAPYLADARAKSIRALRDHVQHEARGMKFFGLAESVVIGRERTIIRAHVSQEKGIVAHATALREEIATTEGEMPKEVLRRRLARLVSGVAVIKVGAPTEAAMRERKDLFEDAASAARAAMIGGIVPGGGWALADAEIEVGGLLGDAMLTPAAQIVTNAGFERMPPTEITTLGYGYDIRKAMDNPDDIRPVNMIEAGIIDPANVVIEALRNAVSVAISLLSTEAVISIAPEEK